MIAPDRLSARDGGLLVIDLQTKVLAPIRYGDLVIANALRLIRGARELRMPTWATEQFPSGLGSSTPEILELIPDPIPKVTFHCLGAEGLDAMIRACDLRHLTLAGIEAHICVAQTAIELIDRGFRVQVAADAVASRNTMDWEFALRRMERAGVILSTTEAVLFEWLETANRPEFKAIAPSIRDFAPPPKRKLKDKSKRIDSDPDD